MSDGALGSNLSINIKSTSIEQDELVVLFREFTFLHVAFKLNYVSISLSPFPHCPFEMYSTFYRSFPISSLKVLLSHQSRPLSQNASECRQC